MKKKREEEEADLTHHIVENNFESLRERGKRGESFRSKLFFFYIKLLYYFTFAQSFSGPRKTEFEALTCDNVW